MVLNDEGDWELDGSKKSSFFSQVIALVALSATSATATVKNEMFS